MAFENVVNVQNVMVDDSFDEIEESSSDEACANKCFHGLIGFFGAGVIGCFSK